MSTTWVIIVIVLVLGVVIGNITLLKYSAKFKFPTPSKPFDDEDGDEYDNPKRDTDHLHAESEKRGDNTPLVQTQVTQDSSAQGLSHKNSVTNNEKPSAHNNNSDNGKKT
ncbi:DUF2897 family protein [Alteromonas sp. BL110]|uniref:DUF2897 family protein n=1 Tax=Alteromonas sp. BL110 TaxID=1714845 RepID=UPI001E2CE883|nr:DUF2897 family protein [Alteromonas sp. BL110]